MKRRRKTKYSMVFATMVAMLSVCTAGVSTFAWFQASSEVRVSASSSSTTITVADPGETAQTGLYIFQDNYTETGSGSEGSKKAIIGKFPSERESLANSIAFDGEKATKTNFKQLVRYGYTVEGNTPAYYTAASSFLPGQRISFAILVDATATKERTLSISGFTSADPNDNRYVHTGSARTTTKIKLAAAINVYGTAISGTYDATNKVFKSGATPDEDTTSAAISKFLRLNQDGSGALSDGFTYAPGDTTTSFNLTTSTPSEGEQDVLFLYTIEFGNSGAALYRHVKDQDEEATEYVSPSFANGSNSYWKQDGTNGSSEVFQGLTFNITSLLIM